MAVFLVSDGESEEKDRAGQNQIEDLELTAPLEPVTIADISQAQRDEQSRICGIEHIGEAITEGKGHHAKLGGDAKDLCHGNDQRNQHERLGRAGGNEEVHAKDRQIDEEDHSPSLQ